VTVELGGSGRVSPEALKYCERGVANLLNHVGALKNGGHALDTPSPRLVHAMTPDSYVFSLAEGVFEPVATLGDEVVSGQLAGQIHKLETPWEPPMDVHFEAEGTVLCQRAYGRTERGDCLYHLGCPALAA